MIQRATNLFALWTILGTIWAWLFPDHFVWVADGSVQPFGLPLVSVLLGVIMLGMGITLSFDDFRRVLTMPRGVAAGVILQFTIMPLTGVALANLLGLAPGLAVGLILVSCCPGGTASNVVTYLARANLALSVTMTMASTLVAIALTPLLTGWLAGVFVEIDRASLFREMVAIVLVPIVAGVMLNRYFPRLTQMAATYSPLLSVLTVVLIVGGIIARSKPLIEANFGILIVSVVLLHASGFGLGYLLGRLFGLKVPEQRTIAIEVGMQNSGLGATLASSPSFAAQFPSLMQAALAPVPSAISAVCHVLFGSLLAAIWRRSADSEMTAERMADQPATEGA